MDGPLVMIEWIDACGCSTEWRNVDSIKKDRTTLCRSAGWLVDPKDDADFVTIVPHVALEDRSDANEQACGDMTISRRTIIKIVRLDLGPPLVSARE